MGSCPATPRSHSVTLSPHLADYYTHPEESYWWRATNVPQSYNTLQSSKEVISVSTSPSAAGTCPQCGEAVPTHRLLIEYETTDGQAAFAECPTCDDVVHPEPA